MTTVKNREDFLRAVFMYLPSHPKCVEIGVLGGDFSKMILDILEPEKLILIDPYRYCADGGQYGSELDYLPKAYSTEEQYQGLIKRFYNEILSGQASVIRKFSYEAEDDFPPHHFDFLYHDGSHLYDDLRRDLKGWLPKMKEGGLICGHDYREFDIFGVIKAVDEFCEEYGFEMIVFNENGGDYALKKKNPNIEYAKQIYKEFKESSI